MGSDLTLVYGFLIGIGLFLLVWFVFVAPAERRDHERRLELVRKRLAEREARAADGEDSSSERQASR